MFSEEKDLMPELHPLKPFLPPHAALLMLGSFPPPKKRWKMDFFYPNFINDMWRIFGIVFFENKNYFLSADLKSFDKDKLEHFLWDKGIALFDTTEEVIRLQENASDRFLQIVTPVRLEKLLHAIPACNSIATTGQKAIETLLSLVEADEPKIGQFSTGEIKMTDAQTRVLRIYRMPSSSRAYPKPIEEKAAVYKKMFREIGLL